MPSSGGNRRRRRRRGAPFLGYGFDRRESPEGMALKEVTRSPQGSETARSREKNCSCSEEATPWIPASAGMTDHCSQASRGSDKIAASASPPRNDTAGRMAGKARQTWLSSIYAMPGACGITALRRVAVATRLPRRLRLLAMTQQDEWLEKPARRGFPAYMPCREHAVSLLSGESR